MLRISIEIPEDWDENSETFTPAKNYSINMEHSLVSIAKWESKWHKPFFESDKNDEETLDYIHCMCLSDIDKNLLNYISSNNIEEIKKYINDPMTATIINKQSKNKRSSSFLTNELLYYYMTAANIPFECQYWHINRLITLLDIVEEKNKPAKKMSRKEVLNNYKELNAARKAKLNTRG